MELWNLELCKYIYLLTSLANYSKEVDTSIFLYHKNVKNISVLTPEACIYLAPTTLKKNPKRIHRISHQLNI